MIKFSIIFGTIFLTVSCSKSYHKAPKESGVTSSTSTSGGTAISSCSSKTPPSNLVVEKLFSTPNKTFSASTCSEPNRCIPYIDQDTGIKITRISDINDEPTMAWAAGSPDQGLTNGYSKYTNVNQTGQYMIAFDYLLYDISSCHYLGPIWANTSKSQRMFAEVYEARWSRKAGEENVIYFHIGGQFFKQDVLVGPSSIRLVYDMSTDPAITAAFASHPPAANEQWGFRMGNSLGEGDWSNDNRYWAGGLVLYNSATQKITAGFVFVFDMVALKVLPGIINQFPNAVDMTPDGKWLTILPHDTTCVVWSPSGSCQTADHTLDNRFYRITDLAAGNVANPVYVNSAMVNNFRSIGHNGWAYDKNGDVVLVFQDNRDDFYKSFNPATGETISLFYTTDLGGWGWGQHIGRMMNVSKKGWVFMSTFGDITNWASNQLLMIEIKPRIQQPRVIRVGTTNNKHISYFSEAFASIDMIGNNIYWGGNWNGTTNLEVYRAELPTNWEALVP